MYQPMPPENLNSHILTVLGLPLLDKLQQLEILFERCTVRQIQEIYPLMVHSIFGVNGNPLGWGLRITTIENALHSFSRLQHFFGVNGIWMHVCHRLLNETTKFDIDIHLLPRKFINMLEAGPMFYADLINIDPLKHQVSTLSLNAFDFYIFHFALYALQPLHTINPIAMQIHNERTKTIYQYLATEYLDNFLPQYPDARIEPSNFSSSVKAPQQMPVQALQPQRKLRYLKLPSSYRNGSSNASGTVSGNTSPQSADSSGDPCRAHVWRSESVLHFFVDIWLRYDIESEHHLPSSDFVGGVRTLVKQINFFANAAHVDHSPLCALRKLSLTMVKGRIYSFLCSLIDRWPLDSSLSVVLELWLSYIQPWRYTLSSNDYRTVGKSYEPLITNAFDGFIMDNLIVYTHIFMLLLPRFERLDYTVYRNAYMLHRLVKTFAQQDLVQRLQRFERLHTGHNYGVDSPHRQVNMFNKSHNNSYNAQWNSSVSSDMPKLCSESMHMKIQNFLYVISMARNSMLTNIISALRKEILERQRSEGYLKNLFKKIIGESSQDELTLRDISRIPEVLRQCIDTFCRTFDVDQETLSMHESLPTEPSPPASPSSQNFSFFDSNNSINSSKVTPMQMSLNASNMQDTVDPALLPIKSNEIKPLVKLLHIISETINERFGSRLETCYEREDFFGKLTRQMLCAPMTEKWFEKSSGNVEFYEKQLPARVSLRPLASISSLFLMAVALCFGHFWCGFSSVGILILCVVFFMYRILLAVLS